MAFDPLPPTLRLPLVEGATHVTIEGLQTGWFLTIEVWSAVALLSSTVQAVLDTGPIRVLAAPLQRTTWLRIGHLEPGAPAPTFGPFRPVLQATPSKYATMPPRIWPCIHLSAWWAAIEGGIPGYEIEVVRGALVLGRGVTDADGRAYVDVRGFIAVGDQISARYLLAGASRGVPARVRQFSLPKPEIREAWADESGVWVENLQPGSPASVTNQTTGAFGWSAPADPAGRLWVEMPSPLAESDSLVPSALIGGPAGDAITTASSDPCDAVDRDILGFVAISPAPPMRLEGPLRGGMQRLRVRGHRPGMYCLVQVFSGISTLEIAFVASGAIQPAREWLGVLTPSGWLDLPEPLTAGDGVRVVLMRNLALLALGNTLPPSAIRIVGAEIPLPPMPGLMSPVARSARAVQVTGVLAASEAAVVDEDLDFLGYAAVEDGPSVRVEVPALNAPLVVYPEALIDLNLSRGAQVPVGPSPVVPVAPRVLEPLLLGDRRVWVSGVPPGAEVQIREVATGGVIGRAVTADSVVRVPCSSTVTGAIEARVLGAPSRSARSPAVNPLTPLRAVADIEDHWFDYGVDAPDVTGFLDPVWGRVWAPAVMPPNPPLVLILHGEPSYDSMLDETCTGLATDESYTGTGAMSYLGYRDLAEALARLGCVVVSVKHDGGFINGALPAMTLDSILVDPSVLGLSTTPTIDQSTPTLLIGHSRGGWALSQMLLGVAGQATSVWSATQAVGFVGFAPYTDVTAAYPIALPIPVVLFQGSGDYLFQFEPPYDTYFEFNSFEKTFVWVRGATHGTWSSVWSARDLRGDLPDQVFEEGYFLTQAGTPATDDPVPWQPSIAATATDLVLAFARDRLFNQTEYRDLLRGPIRPERAEELGWSLSHTIPVTELADEFPVAAPNLLDWPQQATAWQATLAGLPFALLPTDLVTVRVEVTEVDGSLVQQPWAQPTDATRLVTYAALDLVAELVVGPIQAGVRLGVVAPLPGRWTVSTGEGVAYPLTVRIPIDAFTGAAPALGPMPSDVALALTDVTPDAAAIVDLVAVQRP